MKSSESIAVLREAILKGISGISQHLIGIKHLLREGFKLPPEKPLPLGGLESGTSTSAHSTQFNPTPLTTTPLTIKPLTPAPLSLGSSQVEQRLQEMTKNTPVATQPSRGYSQSEQRISGSNGNVERLLSELNDKMAVALSSPRSLTVQSPSPVSDAASIWSEIAYNSTVAAGLA